MSQEIITQVAVMEVRLKQLTETVKELEEHVSENTKVTKALQTTLNVAKIVITILLPVLGYFLNKIELGI